MSKRLSNTYVMNDIYDGNNYDITYRGTPDNIENDPPRYPGGRAPRRYSEFVSEYGVPYYDQLAARGVFS